MSATGPFSIDDLRALVAVAEAGTVTKAAEVLGVRQPSLSRRLDVFRGPQPILRKKGGRLELTERGQGVLAAARSLLRQYDHLTAYTQGRRDRPKVILVASGSVASQWLLAPACAAMMDKFSDWDIRTRIARGEDRIIGTADGTFDLAVVSHTQLQIENIVRWSCGSECELQVDELGEHPLGVVAGKKSRYANDFCPVLAGQEIPLSRLANWELVGLDARSGVRRQLESRFAGTGTQLRFRLEGGGWLAAKEYAKHNLGVAIVPLALLRKDDQADLIIRRISQDVTVRHAVVYRASDDREAVTAMRGFLADAARAHIEESRRRWHGLI